MKRFIEYIVLHPIRIIVSLFVVTAALSAGIPLLEIEPSTEALMPHAAKEYRYNMRMKKLFGDSKLYMLTLIEEKEYPLFSADSFVLINELVEEIEEFHEFHVNSEIKRLDAILKLGSVTWEEEKAENSAQDDELISDEDIDALLMEDSAVVQDEYFDVFDIKAKLPDDIYAESVRARRSYSYASYTPVYRNEIEAALDHAGRRQLETVLLRCDLNTAGVEKPFTKNEYRAIVEEFESAFLYKSMEAVKSFMNPLTGEDITGTESSLIPQQLVETDEFDKPLLPQTEEDFAAYKKRLLANPVFADNLYSLDDSGEIEALAMNIQLEVLHDPDFVSRYLMDAINKYNSGKLLFSPVGVPVFERYVQDYMKRDMLRFMPFVFLVVILTFFLNFRMLRGVVLPTLSVAMSIIWTMGVMGFLGIPITIVVNVLPTILVAVGSSYSIHIFNQYLHDERLIKQEGLQEGLILSMSYISFTVLLAALTTFIGFSTLGFNQVVSLKHFGVFSALGTVFSMLIASMLIPSALSLMHQKGSKKKTKKRAAILSAILEKAAAIALNYPLRVLLVSLMLFILAALGLTKLQIESSPVAYFKDNSYPVLAEEKVGQALHGSFTVNLMIDSGKPNGVKDPEFLSQIDRLGQWIESGESRDNYQFLASFTFADIIKRMHKAMNSDDSNFYRIPEGRLTVEDYLLIYSGEDRDSDGLVDTMERFVDPHYRVANVFIKTGSYGGAEFSTARLLKGIKFIKAKMDADPYFSKLEYAFAGQAINYAVLNTLIARGQVITIILTLCIIAAMIYLLFRDIKAALVSLIPISFSICLVFGLMGYLGIPLDIAKSIIAAITIGIGIDDTIHMLKTIRFNLYEGHTLKDSILNSYRESGVAIVYTSVALIFGFSVLMLSEFKVIFYFGWLVAMNMLATTVAALLILPAAVWLLKIEFNVSKAAKRGSVRPENAGSSIVAVDSK